MSSFRSFYFSNMTYPKMYRLIQVLLFMSLYLMQISHGSKAEFVTCGTILKLINTDLRLRLHSHDVKYGSGSGQQSVTAVDVSDDNNSHWLVRPAMGETCKRGMVPNAKIFYDCMRPDSMTLVPWESGKVLVWNATCIDVLTVSHLSGTSFRAWAASEAAKEPIKCNTNIRIQHVGTKKNLHSHYFSSPLSGNQEVSCYGDEDGEGDSGDNWTVVCNNDYWRRDTPVKLRHVDTAAYLAGSGRTFGRPINGQGEIVGVSSQYGTYTDWQAKEGLFIHPGELLPHQHAIHTEL